MGKWMQGTVVGNRLRADRLISLQVEVPQIQYA